MRGLLRTISATAIGRRLGLPRTLPVFVLMLGLVATAAATWQVSWLSESKDRERFDNAVDQANADISDRMQAYTAILRAGAGLFDAQAEGVSRAGFAAFADHLQLRRIYPGVQGIGFSRRVTAQELPALEQAMRLQGHPDFAVRPAAPRTEYHAIVYLHPQDSRNAAAIGYDMFTHPVRRAAMAAARDSGEAVMSGKVELVQEITADKQPGFLIYHPIYRGGDTPPTVEARRALLRGFVYAPFRADDLLNGVFRAQHNPRVHFALYDGAPRPENLLHRSFEHQLRARFTSARTIQVANRTWTVVYSTRPEFEIGSSRMFGPLFFAGGLLATLLVAAATWSQVRARLSAEEEVAAREVAERQMRLLVDELNHRVKNTLATVQSVAAQTLREGQSPAEARDAFEARLVALSQTHDLLTKHNWRGAALHDLVQVEVAPYDSADGGRFSVAGQPLELPPHAAVAIGMALHELATNAAKYGALSTPEGQVAISWRREAGGRLRLLWRELGGPPVAPPRRRGFGTRLIETGLKRQLQGQVKLVFEPSGVRCTIDMPLEPANGNPMAWPQVDSARAVPRTAVKETSHDPAFLDP